MTTSEIEGVETFEVTTLGARPTDKAYSPAEAREKIRGRLAIALLTIIGLVVLVSLIWVCAVPGIWAVLKEWLGAIFAPLITLFGTITGFYFGEKSKE